ncbi:MAG: hypothetical protein ACO3E4_06330 [Candidatus Nanopelagicaceae bacterium]
MAEDEDIRRARAQRARIDATAQAQIVADADPLAALQKSVAESKAQVEKKNIEIPTIALEQAVNTGDIDAIRAAATELGKAQGLSGSELRTFSYKTTQTAAKGEKPTPPAADEQFTYDYVWRQDVGGPGGKWVLTKTPNAGVADWKFDSYGMLFYKGKAYTGNYEGIDYVDGKGPGYKENSGGGGTIYRTIGGILYANGSKYTGVYQGKNYVDGVEQADDGSGGKTTYTAPDGRIFTDLGSYNAYIAQTAAEEKRRAGQSAYDLLFSEFDRYGLGALIEPLKGFIQEGLSEAELTLRLRDTDAYKKRFAANQARVKNGLRALSEAEYIGLEDQYQDVMRRYGLPESYYTRGDMGRQEGFEKFIGGDVSPVELEDRIQTAQNRVVNANPEVSKALREFYPEITGGDILAYALDPAQAITNIKRKVGAAEIGAGAMQAGLKTGLARAEELQRYGVTKETAQQGFGTIASGLERGRQLSSIYQQPTYTQEVAETEVFALPDAEKARRQRRRLGQLETATFSGTTGMTGGALDRERAGQY